MAVELRRRLWWLAIVALIVSGCDVADPVSGSRPPNTTVPRPVPTIDLVPGQLAAPEGLGEDQDLDLLAVGCFEGDFVACDDLYVNSPAGSAYEQYALMCAGRNEPTGNCFSQHYVFSVDTAPRGGDGSSDDQARVVEVRTGRHESFDRFVVELEIAVAPGYLVEYVEGRSDAGVVGEAFLAVSVEPAFTEDDPGLQLAPSDTRNIKEVALTETGPRVTWIIGLAVRTGFEVSVVEDPIRVVVDISHN